MESKIILATIQPDTASKLVISFDKDNRALRIDDILCGAGHLSTIYDALLHVDKLYTDTYWQLDRLYKLPPMPESCSFNPKFTNWI